MDREVIPAEETGQRILFIRGRRVILDADLARMYGVPTKALNQAVKRNRDRFPDDFAFRLTETERSEVVTNRDHLHRLKFSSALPLVFTEHGAVMAASMIDSPQAVRVSVFAVRAFVRLREILSANEMLARKLAELEGRLAAHDTELGEHAKDIQEIVLVIRRLMKPPKPRPDLRVTGLRPGAGQ